MNPEQLIEFIRQQLATGKTRAEVEQILRINNVSPNEMDIAFNAAEWQMNQNLPVPHFPPTRHYGMIWLTVILALILLVSGAGAYLVLFQPERASELLGITLPEPAPLTAPVTLPAITAPVATSTATSTDTNGWKTYRNEKYGFEFKYPNGTAVSETPSGARVENWELGIFENPKRAAFVDWFKSHFPTSTNKDCDFADSNLSIGGYRSYLVSAPTLPKICTDGGYYTINTDQQKVVKIILGQDPLPEYSWRKILSTFRFTDTSTATTTDTSGKKSNDSSFLEPPPNDTTITASIMARLSSLRAEAELVYSEEVGYSGVCSSQKILKMFAEIEKINPFANPTCKVSNDGQKYIMTSSLANGSGTNFCIDNTGTAKELPTQSLAVMPANSFTCPSN